MRIEFVKEWRVYRPGQVTDQVPAGVADALVRRGIAKAAVAAQVPVKKRGK